MTFTAHLPDVRFVPHPLLRDGHAMTIAPAFWPRKLPAEFAGASTERVFEVEKGVRVLTHCHWQINAVDHPTLLVLHGLEGCADSNHVKGIGYKAFAAGMNVVRMNLRNCGGSMHLTPTLYNAGLSADVTSVVRELSAEGLHDICLVGYSLGGNIVLKAAGEMGDTAGGAMRAVAAISPSVDLETCITAIELPHNRVYEQWFLRTLKQKIRDKARLFPELYDLSKLVLVRSIRDFDDTYTAPHGGYGTAANYYKTASAKNFLQRIRVPTLIIAAEDDPLVPFESFEGPALRSPFIRLYATSHGGHAGFIQHKNESEQNFDRFWAENRVVSFCQEVLAD